MSTNRIVRTTAQTAREGKKSGCKARRFNRRLIQANANTLERSGVAGAFCKESVEIDLSRNVETDREFEGLFAWWCFQAKQHADKFPAFLELLKELAHPARSTSRHNVDIDDLASLVLNYHVRDLSLESLEHALHAVRNTAEEMLQNIRRVKQKQKLLWVCAVRGLLAEADTARAAFVSCVDALYDGRLNYWLNSYENASNALFWRGLCTTEASQHLRLPNSGITWIWIEVSPVLMTAGCLVYRAVFQDLSEGTDLGWVVYSSGRTFHAEMYQSPSLAIKAAIKFWKQQDGMKEQHRERLCAGTSLLLG